MKRFAQSLIVFCITMLTVACGNETVKELKSLVNWNPEYTKNWAPAIGASLPMLSVKDTSGETPDFEDLSGEKGLLIFFVRSTNW